GADGFAGVHAADFPTTSNFEQQFDHHYDDHKPSAGVVEPIEKPGDFGLGADFAGGVGVTGSSGVVNPLVNTQFQYIDVGVNIEVTPRVHPDGDISLKGTVDVSQITGTSNIGGINQPVIGQKKTEIDVRLKEGEPNILAGLIERTDTNNVNGIPGLGELPLTRYLF